MEDPHIQKLLRLKKFEQPPPGYFDHFLDRFRDRQRVEILKRPVWDILVERLQAHLDAFRVPALAYCGVLIAAVGISVPMLRDDGLPETTSIAQVAPASMGLVSSSQNTQIADRGEAQTRRAPSSLPPQYVLQSRPVSYESSLSF